MVYLLLLPQKEQELFAFTTKRDKAFREAFENALLSYKFYSKTLIKKLDGPAVVSNQSHDDTQRQRIIIGLDSQSNGREAGSILADVKKKEPGLSVAILMKKTEKGMNARNSERMKLMSDGPD